MADRIATLADSLGLAPDAPLLPAIEALLGALESVGSRRVYASDLRAFFRFCAARELAPERVTREVLIGYLAELADRGLAPDTRRRVGVVLRRLYEEAIEADLYQGPNPARRLARIRAADPASAPALDAEERAALLAMRDDPRTGRAALRANRDRLLIELLYLTGLRAAEAAALRFGDCGRDRGRPTLSVRRKGGVRVTIKSSPALEAAISTWRAELGAAGGGASGSDPLFPAHVRPGSPPLTTRSISRIADRELARVGRRGPRTAAHLIRKTSITDVYLASHDVLLAQRHAGHRQTSTTVRHYIDPADRLAESGIDHLARPARVVKARDR